MFSMHLAWKGFSLDLPSIELWLRANAGEFYVGNSADEGLTLWFSEQPDQADLDAVQAYWDALDEESDEASNYVSKEDIVAAISTLKAGIPAKAWDDMSVAERKIVLGQMPTNAELGL